MFPIIFFHVPIEIEINYFYQIIETIYITNGFYCNAKKLQNIVDI